MSKTREWITQTEAARRFGCKPGMIRRLVRSQQLSVCAIPRTHPKIEAGELARLIKSHTHPAAHREPIRGAVDSVTYARS